MYSDEQDLSAQCLCFHSPSVLRGWGRTIQRKEEWCLLSVLERDGKDNERTCFVHFFWLSSCSPSGECFLFILVFVVPPSETPSSLFSSHSSSSTPNSRNSWIKRGVMSTDSERGRKCSFLVDRLLFSLSLLLLVSVVYPQSPEKRSHSLRSVRALYTKERRASLWSSSWVSLPSHSVRRYSERVLRHSYPLPRKSLRLSSSSMCYQM